MEEAVSEKKCPNCGKWSRWTQQVDDVCEHCGALLDADRLQRQQDRQERREEQKKKFNITLIKIWPHDHWLIKGIKYVIRAGQIAFIAILSFFIWLITVVSG